MIWWLINLHSIHITQFNMINRVCVKFLIYFFFFSFCSEFIKFIIYARYFTDKHTSEMIFRRLSLSFCVYLFIVLLTLYGASNNASMSKSSAIFLCFDVVFGIFIYLLVVVVVVVVDEIACTFYRCKFTAHCYMAMCCVWVAETLSVSFALPLTHSRYPLSPVDEKFAKRAIYTMKYYALIKKICCFFMR